MRRCGGWMGITGNPGKVQSRSLLPTLQFLQSSWSYVQIMLQIAERYHKVRDPALIPAFKNAQHY